jgi:hypothetical protein
MDEVSPAKIEQPRARLHLAQAFRIDEIFRLRRSGQQQQDEVGLRQHLVGPFGRQDVGEVRHRDGTPLRADHPHPQRRGQASDLLPDGA